MRKRGLALAKVLFSKETIYNHNDKNKTFALYKTMIYSYPFTYSVTISAWVLCNAIASAV